MPDFQQILTLGPHVLLVLGIQFGMMFVKGIPRVPKWALPFAACLIGMFVFPLICDAGKVGYSMPSPTTGLRLHGFLLGAFAACSNHAFQLFLKSRGLTLPTGDTEMITKTVETKQTTMTQAVTTPEPCPTATTPLITKIEIEKEK